MVRSHEVTCVDCDRASRALTIPQLAHSETRASPVAFTQPAQAPEPIESNAGRRTVPREFCVPAGRAGFVAVSDGGLRMKFGGDRKRAGRLSLTGRGLDAPAKPLRAFIPEMPANIGFQSSNLIFPTSRCWEVTGELGGDALNFVVLVIKIGDGPTDRLDR